MSVCGLLLTCAQTGVTLASTGSDRFYSNTTGSATVTTPGGNGGDCPATSGSTYSSGSSGGTFAFPGTTANLVVTKL